MWLGCPPARVAGSSSPCRVPAAKAIPCPDDYLVILTLDYMPCTDQGAFLSAASLFPPLSKKKSPQLQDKYVPHPRCDALSYFRIFYRGPTGRPSPSVVCAGTSHAFTITARPTSPLTLRWRTDNTSMAALPEAPSPPARGKESKNRVVTFTGKRVILEIDFFFLYTIMFYRNNLIL